MTPASSAGPQRPRSTAANFDQGWPKRKFSCLGENVVGCTQGTGTVQWDWGGPVNCVNFADKARHFWSMPAKAGMQLYGRQKSICCIACNLWSVRQFWINMRRMHTTSGRNRGGGVVIPARSGYGSRSDGIRPWRLPSNLFQRSGLGWVKPAFLGPNTSL